MKTTLVLVVALLALAPVVAPAAPFLSWDPVLTDPDGLPLPSGEEVTEYRVYQCGPGIGSCTRLTAARVGVILAPTTQFDLAGQPVPVVYVVTAANKLGESPDSLPFKVTPPGRAAERAVTGTLERPIPAMGPSLPGGMNHPARRSM